MSKLKTLDDVRFATAERSIDESEVNPLGLVSFLLAIASGIGTHYALVALGLSDGWSIATAMFLSVASFVGLFCLFFTLLAKMKARCVTTADCMRVVDSYLNSLRAKEMADSDAALTKAREELDSRERTLELNRRLLQPDDAEVHTRLAQLEEAVGLASGSLAEIDRRYVISATDMRRRIEWVRNRIELSLLSGEALDSPLPELPPANAETPRLELSDGVPVPVSVPDEYIIQVPPDEEVII